MIPERLMISSAPSHDKTWPWVCVCTRPEGRWDWRAAFICKSTGSGGGIHHSLPSGHPGETVPAQKTRLDLPQITFLRSAGWARERKRLDIAFLLTTNLPGGAHTKKQIKPSKRLLVGLVQFQSIRYQPSYVLLPLVLWNRKATQKILNETHNRSRFTFLFEQAALERIETRAQPPHTGAGWFWLTAKPLPAFRVMIRNRFGSVRAIHKSTCKIRVTFTCNSISRYHGELLLFFFFTFPVLEGWERGFVY